MKMLLRTALAALLGLAACDGATDPDDARSGSLSLTYAGAGRSGSISASGPLRLGVGGEPQWGSFAVAMRTVDGNDEALLVTAFQARQQPRGDVVGLFVDPLRGTGDYSLDVACDPDRAQRCAFGLFGLNENIAAADFDASPQGEAFVFLAGTLTITRLDDRSVEGTFAGRGVFYDFATEQASSGVVDVTGGRFRLPVVSLEEIGELAPSGSLARARAPL